MDSEQRGPSASLPQQAVCKAERNGEHWVEHSAGAAKKRGRRVYKSSNGKGSMAPDGSRIEGERGPPPTHPPLRTQAGHSPSLVLHELLLLRLLFMLPAIFCLLLLLLLWLPLLLGHHPMATASPSLPSAPPTRLLPPPPFCRARGGRPGLPRVMHDGVAAAVVVLAFWPGCSIISL